jgi:iron complex outermembrane receptor protein
MTVIGYLQNNISPIQYPKVCAFPPYMLRLQVRMSSAIGSMRWPNHVRYRKSKKKIRGAALNRPTRIGIGILLLTASALALAQQPAPQHIVEKTVVLNLAPQPLEDALHEFSRATGLKVMLYTVLGRGIISPRVSGTLTPGAALDLLLKGAALRFEYLDDQTIAVLPTQNQTAIDPVQPMTRLVSDRIRVASAADREPNNTPKTSHQNELDEIVVTAQKREERLQDVPMSISVLGGKELDKASFEGVSDALNSVPGVMTQESYIGGGTQVAIRGVAASSTILHGSSPIAYYLDSVPFGLIKTSIGPDSNAYDLERVEVLRGPQGTLYGASALNGVVRVLTHDADLNDLEFKARIADSGTDGGGNNYRGDMAVNIPIVEGKLAARAVVGYEDNSGWIDRPNKKDANDAELRNYRLKVNAQPTDALSIGLSAWSSHDNYGAPSMAGDDGRYPNAVNEPMSSHYDAYGIKVGYDLPAFSVSSMTSYLDYANSGSLDLTPIGVPGIPFVNKYFAHVLSQEINLNSARGGSWLWSVGGIYRDAKDRTFQTITGIFPAPVDFNDTSHSFAGYGELTRLFLGGQLELTGGLRYFEDHVGTNEITSSTGVPNAPLVRVSSNFHKTTPRVVLNWHPSDQLTAYASYAEGFRSGFQQQPNVILTNPQLPPVGADSLKNYEVGAKGNLLNGRVSFDTAVYYIDWQHVQSDAEILINGIPVVALTNGNSASGIGVDFALTTTPVDGLELGVNFSENNLAWDSAVYSNGAILFEKGDRLSLSPKWTAGALANYSFPLGGSGYSARFSTSATYNSSQFIKTATGFGQADAILIARASFAISSSAHWATTIYVDNLNNNHGIVEQAPFAVPFWAVRPRPRTIGLQLEYRY